MTPEETEQLKARYESGEPITALASSEHSQSEVYRSLLAAGVVFRAKGRVPGMVKLTPRIARMIDLRNSGKSLAEIARKFRTSPQAVHRHIQYHKKGSA